MFAGGFTLDAVIGVCSDDALDASETFTVLSALVDKSLVAFEAHERYRILETMREYAGERLTESGRFETFARRHAAFFREYVRRQPDRRFGTVSGVARAARGPNSTTCAQR